MRGRRKARRARGEERQGRRTRRELVGAGSGAVCDAVGRLFCGTYFARCMYYAFGVLCRGICMRYITLASCVTLPCSCGHSGPSTQATTQQQQQQTFRRTPVHHSVQGFVQHQVAVSILFCWLTYYSGNGKNYLFRNWRSEKKKTVIGNNFLTQKKTVREQKLEIGNNVAQAQKRKCGVDWKPAMLKITGFRLFYLIPKLCPGKKPGNR